MNNLNSINNNGQPYYFPADIAKEGDKYVRISSFFKTRVGDNGKVLPFKWYDQGRVMNVHGFIPFIQGLIGKFNTDDNDEVIMAPDASYREWQGSTANAHDGGFMDYILEDQMFPQEGIFKGHFGLKDGNGNVLTSVNIIFEVLGNDLRVGETVKYYVGELENLKNQYKIQGEQAVKDFNAQIEAGTEIDRQALDALRASIQANRDGQASIAEQQAAITRQINDQDIITKDEHNNSIKDIANSINQRLADMKLTPTPFDNADALKAQYPTGTDGIFLTQNDKHLWTWINDSWQDLGPYQAVQLDKSTNEKINDDSNHVRKENLIPNGSFTTGVAPATANTANFKLFTSQYMNRTWLNMTSEVTGKYQGVHFDIKAQGEHFSYPIHLSWDWQSSQPSTFYINVLYLDESGKQVGFQNIGKYWINSWRFTHFDQYVNLDKTQSTCYKWQIQIYRDGQDAFPTSLLTDVSATLAYDADTEYDNSNQIVANKNAINDVSNHVLKENLIPNGSFNDLSSVKTKTMDTNIFVNQYFNRNWLNINSSGSGTDKGVFWDIPFPQETIYPFTISFDIHSDQQTHLALALATLDDKGQQVNWQSINNVNISQYKFIHYKNTFKLVNSQNAKTLRILLFKSGTAPLPTLMLTDMLMYANYDNADNLQPEYVSKKNLILNGDFNTGSYPAMPMDATQTLTTNTYLDRNWLNFGDKGVLWGFDLTKQNGEAYSYTYDLSFTIQFTKDTDVKIQQMFYDRDHKFLGTYVVDKKRFKSYRFTDYHKKFKLKEFDDATTWELQIAPNNPGQVANVALYQLFDTANIDYSLPIVYLDGDTDGMNKSTFKDMHFNLVKNGIETSGYAKVKWQGDSSLTFPKKGLRIKLYENDTYSDKLKIQPKKSWKPTSKFNLKAYPNDALICHDVVNANIGSDIWGTNLSLPSQMLDETNLGFIDGFPIVLFINNGFQGIYSFNLARSDFDNTKYAVIGDQYTDTTQFKKSGVKLDETDFESLYPEDKTDDEKKAVDDLIDFVANSTDDDFKANLNKHVDINSAIDYLIFSNVIGDGDAWGKNQVLLSYDGKIWYWHPYDLDGSYGLNWTGGFSIQEGKIWGNDHKLFERLTKLFLPQIQARYTQLRAWLTPSYIVDKYVDYINNIGTENYQLDWNIWQPKSQKENTINNLRKNVYNQFKIMDKTWLIS